MTRAAGVSYIGASVLGDKAVERESGPRDALLVYTVRVLLPLLLYGGAGRRNARGEDEQDELKTSQSFERPGRNLPEDAAFFVCGKDSGTAERREGAMKIKNWRKKIDAIDSAMLQLLNLRTELALEVGRLKDERGLALRVPAREQEIISRMRRTNPGPLSNESVARIYQLILNESIRTQERNGFGKTAGGRRARANGKRRKADAA